MRKKLLGLFSIIFTIVLLVSCTGKTFEVDFDLNGGTVAEAIEVQKIKKEGLVTKPTENPTKEGYTFTFWAQESGDEWKFQEDKVTEATTLYAQWEINEYNVTFDVKGGTPAPEAQVVEFGEKATKPADPTAVGKVFLGWFEAEAAEAYDFDKTVSKDLALEARWSDLNVYTVTFDAKSEQANPSDIKLFDGEVATKPANPTKAGHTFLGWFEDGATAVYDFSKPVTKNIDLVARWEIHTFEVTFDVDGEKSSEELNYNEKVAEPDEPTKAGYDFVGWYLEDALYNFDTPVTEDIVLVAKWEIQVYAVKFDSSGGSAVANQNIKYNEKVVKPANPTRENYNFMGWYLANAEYDFDTPVTKAITLVAKWEIYKYDVEFDVDGGTPAIAKQVVNHGGYVTQPDNPTKKDYIFLGWFVDGEEFVFTDKIIEDTVLKARWQLDYVGALAALIAHYENTLGNMAWSPTADVELLAVINSAPITWTSSAPDYFSNTGKINIPTFTEGNQTIMLTAELSPVQSHVFFFIIEAAEQTTEELLIEILDTVTIVPVSTTGFQENNFEVTNSWKIGEEDVEITWQTSDATVMKANGELVSFEDAPSKEVTLKASITYNGVTKDKEILFVVKGVSTYSSFLEALVDANKGEKVKVEGVYLFTSISSTSTSSGYYLASADNMIAFVYGAIPSNLKVGKLYDVLFTVDIYYGSFQLNGVALIEERDGELPPVTPVEMTIEDVVNLPKPLDTSFNHTYLKLTNVEVRIDKNITDDRYNTFLVPQDLPADTPLTDQNSIMVYYVSDLDVIKALNGRRIDEILLINNGYRTNNLCWYVNYIGNGSDIVMGALSDAETVIEVKNQLASLVPHRILDAKGITLPVEREGSAIAWTSSHPEILAADGTVVLPAAGTEVTLTASITKGEAEAVYEKVVWVGTPESLTPDKTTDVIAYDGSFDLMPFKVVGVVTGATGNRSYTLQDASGAIGLYALTSQVLEYGYEYTIIGIKSVNQGINQLQNFTFVKGELKPLPDPVVLTEANLKDDKYMGTLRAHLVSFNDAEISKLVVDNYGTTEITLKLGTATVVMRWDNRVLITEESLAHLRGLNVGDKVNIVGAPVGWYNAPQLGYNDASQIQAISLESNEEKVAAAIAALDIPQNAKTDIVLPTTGRFDTNIVWASSNPEIIAVDGKITLPTENTFVTLTATVTAGEFTDTAEFVVYVQVDDTVMSIAIAFASAADTEVEFIGVVTGFTDYSTQYSNYDKVWLEDATGTITVYRGAFAPDLAVGDKYRISGKMAAYNGLIQVAQGSTQTLIDRDNALIAPTNVIDVTVLKPVDQASRINVTGIVKSINATGRQMVVTVGETDVTVRSISDTSPVNTHILTGSVGQKVYLKGIHVDWFNGVQLLPTLDVQIEFADLTDAEKLQLAIAELEDLFADKGFNMGSDIVLPLTGAQGSTIAWTIDPVDAIADGKWFDVTADTEVTLTAVLTLGEAEAVELTLKVTIVYVKADGENETYTETFETAELSTNSSVYSNVNYKGVADVNWVIVHSMSTKAETADGNYDIDGQSIILRRADEPSSITATFTNGLSAFSFDYMKAFTGGTARKYSVDVTNNGVTTTYEIPEFGSGSGLQDTVYKFEYNGPALSGEVIIKIYARGAKGNQQASFDNFTWTENN